MGKKTPTRSVEVGFGWIGLVVENLTIGITVIDPKQYFMVHVSGAFLGGSVWFLDLGLMGDGSFFVGRDGWFDFCLNIFEDI